MSREDDTAGSVGVFVDIMGAALPGYPTLRPEPTLDLPPAGFSLDQARRPLTRRKCMRLNGGTQGFSGSAGGDESLQTPSPPVRLSDATGRLSRGRCERPDHDRGVGLAGREARSWPA